MELAQATSQTLVLETVPWASVGGRRTHDPTALQSPLLVSLEGKLSPGRQGDQRPWHFEADWARQQALLALRDYEGPLESVSLRIYPFRLPWWDAIDWLEVVTFSFEEKAERESGVGPANAVWRTGSGSRTKAAAARDARGLEGKGAEEKGGDTVREGRVPALEATETGGGSDHRLEAWEGTLRQMELGFGEAGKESARGVWEESAGSLGRREAGQLQTE